VTTLKPSIHNALIHIVDKKPAFAALPLGNVVALVKGDLVSLNASTIAFANALIDGTPVSSFLLFPQYDSMARSFPAFVGKWQCR